MSSDDGDQSHKGSDVLERFGSGFHQYSLSEA
jgi:hypothetical protein